MEGNEGDHYFKTAIVAFQSKETKQGSIETSSVMLVAQPFVILILNCQRKMC